MKKRIVGMILSAMFIFSAISGIAQDPEGTYIDESGEIQDSLRAANVLAFGNEKSDNNTLIIVIIVAAVVLAAGIIIVLMRRKKKAA